MAGGLFTRSPAQKAALAKAVRASAAKRKESNFRRAKSQKVKIKLVRATIKRPKQDSKK